MSEQIINSFNKGMHSGIDPSVFPEGSYRTMRNGHIFARNDRGFVVTNITKPSEAFSLTEGYVPIGSCEFNGKLYIMSYNASGTPMVEFGVYTPDATPLYSPLATLSDAGGSGRPLRIDASLIGYSKEHLVSMFPRVSYDGSVNLYICDGYNANIVVNTEREYINTAVNPLEASDFAQFKSLDSMPEIEAEVINGGYMKPGNYFFAFRYTTKDYNSTIFFNQIGPYCISEDDRGTLDIEDITLPKSVKLTIEGMDADYRHVEIGVLRYFGETEVQSFEMYLVTKKFTENGSVIIDGREDKINLTPEELLKNNILVSTCKSHVQHNNRYFGANWTSDIADLHDKLAKAAGKIVPEYVIKTGDDDEQMITDAFNRNYADINSYKEMKYKAGECYPFAASFVISGKYITDAYPICGYDGSIQSRFEVMADLEVDPEWYKENKGIYRFPFARKNTPNTAVLGRRYFYGMMGVNFDISLAVGEIADIDVTSILIMQGDRIVNCESQGLVLPMISRFIVHRKEWYSRKIDDSYIWRSNSMIVALGAGDRKIKFPWFYYNVPNQNVSEGSATPYKIYNFPIMFVRPSTNPLTPIMNYNQLAYAAAYQRKSDFDEADKQMPGAEYEEGGYKKFVIKPGENPVQTHYVDFNDSLERAYHVTYHNATQIAAPTDIADEQTAMRNSRTDCTDYAYYCPDNMNSARLFSGIIRTVQRIIYSSSVQRSNNKKPAISTQPLSSYANSDSMSFNTVDRGFDYLIDTANTDNAVTNVFGTDKYHKWAVNMQNVNSNNIIPDDNGCISRMKSVFEVFGPLNSVNGDDSSYFATNLSGRTRQELMQAGIMLNRFKFRHDKQTSESTLKYLSESVQDQKKLWCGIKVDHESDTTQWPLPLIILNPSMMSAPYSYFEADVENEILYEGETTSDNFIPDYIVERYLYDPDIMGGESPYEILKRSFSPNNERYYPISVLTVEDSISEDIYKGDVFAQVVTFRFNRWTHEPLHNPKEEDYRHGQAARVYLESYKNHNLRVSDLEQTFFPYAEKMGFNIQDFAFKSNSDRLTNESWSYNAGHMELRGMFSRYGIDINDPVATTDKPNRVYWSSIYTDGSFEDAYRDIAVGNYKDFNPENGIIQKIVKHSDRLFIIQERGISQLYEANSLEQSEDSSSIVIGDPGVLYPQTHELSTYGTQHPESIVTGANGVYGVDWMQKKIWSIQLKISDRGNFFHIVEDLLESKSLRTFFKDLEGANYKPMNTLANTLFASTPIGIASGADQELGKIYFTFHIADKIETLVYDENQQVFLGYYDYTPNIYLPFRNKCLMFKSGSVKVLQPEGATTYNNSEAAEEALGPFVLEFYVNGISGQRNLSNLQKEYILHRIFGSDNLLKLDDYEKDIEWSTEYQDSKFISTEDKDEFWRTPYFEDHVWYVPVSVAEQGTGNKGPEGTAAYESFEAGSTMRGEWLKVKLTYRGTEEIYIKNIVTDILNSFS